MGGREGIKTRGRFAMVPSALRTWFIVHFFADWLVALPLFIAPEPFLRMLGWTEVDPMASRIVAAALFGIGTQSLLARNATAGTFRELLGLKVIWSSTATVGIVWSTLDGGPAMGWAFAAVFAAFCGLWSYYRVRLSSGA
jgi:hypothetical protein